MAINSNKKPRNIDIDFQKRRKDNATREFEKDA